MRRDPFDLTDLRSATPWEIFTRVLFLSCVIAILLLDLFVWRPN